MGLTDSAFGRFAPLRVHVMFVVEVGSVFTTVLFFQALGDRGEAAPGFIAAVSLWLWFTVLFANFAEAMAEGRGKAKADALRGSRKDTPAKKLTEDWHAGSAPTPIDRPALAFETVSSTTLRKGDVVLIEAGDDIPCDGEILEGVASVNEAAITGESAPVIREAGGDRSAVVAGTRLLSDWMIVKVAADPGETFLDRMISMVEGAKRQKTPNEIALNILLAALTIVFLLATVTLLPFSIFSVKATGSGQPVTMTVLVALLVCLWRRRCRRSLRRDQSDRHVAHPPPSRLSYGSADRERGGRSPAKRLCFWRARCASARVAWRFVDLIFP
ncbi:MAG TPA: hypothetical protein VM925_18645 [Labilithrix sp.]|nr:hypothetical protein [Labilithrix sp.]